MATTFREKLAKQGIIFCSISEAVKDHPDLVRRYLGTVVPYKRLEKLFALMEAEMDVLQVEKKIRRRVKRQMEKTQRDYYLKSIWEARKR